MDNPGPPTGSLPPGGSVPPPYGAASAPPPLTPPPRPPSKSSSGRGWKTAVIVLGLLLLFSLFVNFVQLVGSAISVAPSGATAGPELREVLLEDQGAADKIAVVPLRGLIFGDALGVGGHSPVDRIKAQLNRAQKDRRVKAVVLQIDSPGGEVLAADAIAKLIKDFQVKSHKPVVAVMGSVAASGGYYVAAPCRWIVAHDLTLTGSIGVILSALNYRGLMDKVGLKPVVYKSGRFKDMLRGSRAEGEISEEEHAMLQRLVDQSFEQFKKVIAEGRRTAAERNGNKGRTLREGWETYADGRVLSGKEAFDIGFVDELGDFRTAVNRALNLVGLKKANLVEYREVVDIGTLLRLLGRSPQTSIKLDTGLKLPPLRTGRLYYIAPNLWDADE